MAPLPPNLRITLFTANDTRVLVPVEDVRQIIGEAVFDAAVDQAAISILNEDITELTP